MGREVEAIVAVDWTQDRIFHQDGMVVGMSRMGDGRKRSTASSTRSHGDQR